MFYLIFLLGVLEIYPHFIILTNTALVQALIISHLYCWNNLIKSSPFKFSSQKFHENIFLKNKISHSTSLFNFIHGFAYLYWTLLNSWVQLQDFLLLLQIYLPSQCSLTLCYNHTPSLLVPLMDPVHCHLWAFWHEVFSVLPQVYLGLHRTLFSFKIQTRQPLIFFWYFNLIFLNPFLCFHSFLSTSLS